MTSGISKSCLSTCTLKYIEHATFNERYSRSSPRIYFYFFHINLIRFRGSSGTSLIMSCSSHTDKNKDFPVMDNGAAGEPLRTKHRVLETGAGILQDFQPVKQICAFLNAFHIYANDPSRCVEANHYCSHITEGEFESRDQN